MHTAETKCLGAKGILKYCKSWTCATAHKLGDTRSISHCTIWLWSGLKGSQSRTQHYPKVQIPSSFQKKIFCSPKCVQVKPKTAIQPIPVLPYFLFPLVFTPDTLSHKRLTFKTNQYNREGRLVAAATHRQPDRPKPCYQQVLCPIRSRAIVFQSCLGCTFFTGNTWSPDQDSAL